MADARAKANALAAAAGVSITGVSSIAEGSTNVSTPIPYMAAAPAKDAASTPIQPGTTEVDIFVSMVFRIG